MKEADLRGNNLHSPSKDEIRLQLGRILESVTFRKSEILRDILAFLAETFIKDPESRVKEHEIATQVLGRPDRFDSRLDSTVRVHTARLRAKLADYYGTEGVQDLVIFEIPKGAYQLTVFYPKFYLEQTRSPAQTGSPSSKEAIAVPQPRSVPWGKIGWGVAAISLACILFLWIYEIREGPPPGLATFWADFAVSGKDSTLVFPNMSGDATTGNGPCYPKQQPPSSPAELFAGIGEVYATGELADLFGHYWHPLKIKRTQSFSWDDGRHQNLILFGGPCVDPQIWQLPPLRYYRFQIDYSDPKLGAYIEDLQHSEHGEYKRYGNSGAPYTFDHAIVSMVHFGNGQRYLLIAGTTTLGTQGAADFLARENTIEGFLRVLEKISPDTRRRIPDFEALLRIEIRNDIPIQTELIGLKIRN